MDTLSCFRAQAYNNAWANHRLFAACHQLTGEELSAERTGFFPSIIRTLNHTLTVDWFYISALEGACVGPSAFDPDVPFPEIGHLDRAQRAADARLIALCERDDDDALARTVDLVRDTWIQTERADRVLLHLFQHQIHHRGQVHAMLAGTRTAPPQLDEFFLGHDREQALRKTDFAELGFDEQAIWR